MLRAKKVVEEAAEAPQEFTVYTEEQGIVRTYSVEVHGENAKGLAEEFAKKVNGIVK